MFAFWTLIGSLADFKAMIYISDWNKLDFFATAFIQATFT
jgi:hypothetical protein